MKINTCTFLTLIILASILRKCSSAGACGENARATGVWELEKEDDASQSYSGNRTTILLMYPVECCGPLDKVWINSECLDNSVINDNTMNWLELHVYRPTSAGSNDLELAHAQYIGNINEKNDDYELPATLERFMLKEGDFFGLKSPTGLVCFDDKGGDSTVNRYHTLTPTTVGLSVPESSYSGNTFGAATFGIYMQADASATPTFTNTGTTGNINNNVGSGESVLTVSVTDTDTLDELTLSMNAHPQFTFDSTSGLVETGTITEESDTAVSLTFTATDICGNTRTQKYRVNIDNDPPTHQNLGATVNLTESTTAATYLYTVVCNDTRTSPVTITYTGGDPFDIRNDNQVYYDGSATLDYDTTPTYTLTIRCSDGHETATANLVVEIQPNIAPTLAFTQADVNVSVTSNTGVFVYRVDVSNPEASDILTFTITSDAGNSAHCADYFDILNNGFIRTKQSMENVTVVGCDYDISVNDGFNTVTGRLTVAFIDFDDPMSCNNLPANRSVFENESPGYEIITVSVLDNDTPQPKTFQLGSSTAELLPYFQIDTNGTITTTSAINYEALTAKSTTLIVQVTDDRMTIYCNVNVYVVNQGEAPSFDSATYVITGTEGPSGQVVGTPGVTVHDDDNGDTLTYTMDCGTSSGRLVMNGTTSEVTFREDYDLDTGSLLTSVNCSFTVRDSYGLTDVAVLDINIDLINDNNPQFSQNAYSILLYPCDVGIGTTVATVTATDADAAPHGTITYALETYQDNDYFYVDQSGRITVVRAINCSTDYNIRITATDQDGGNDTADVEIRVSATTPAPTTTQSLEYMTTFEDWRNYLWLVPMVIILLVTFVVVCWVACTCRGEQGCSAVLSRIRGGRKITLHRAERARKYGNHGNHGTPDLTDVCSIRRPPPRTGHSWQQ